MRAVGTLDCLLTHLSVRTSIHLTIEIHIEILESFRYSGTIGMKFVYVGVHNIREIRSEMTPTIDCTVEM